jgi:hypothetical protein
MSIKHSAILAAFTLATLVAAPAFAAPTPRTATPARVEATTGAAPRASQGATLDAEAARYAKRETRAKKQQDYKGGDYLVVGISTGAAIVILIIVLILI